MGKWADQEIIKDNCTVYKQLYAKDSIQQTILDGFQFSAINEDEANWMERPFKEQDEVFNKVRNMYGDKVPSPDDYARSCF